MNRKRFSFKRLKEKDFELSKSLIDLIKILISCANVLTSFGAKVLNLARGHYILCSRDTRLKGSKQLYQFLSRLF